MEYAEGAVNVPTIQNSAGRRVAVAGAGVVVVVVVVVVPESELTVTVAVTIVAIVVSRLPLIFLKIHNIRRRRQKYIEKKCVFFSCLVWWAWSPRKRVQKGSFTMMAAATFWPKLGTGSVSVPAMAAY